MVSPSSHSLYVRITSTPPLRGFHPSDSPLFSLLILIPGYRPAGVLGGLLPPWQLPLAVTVADLGRQRSEGTRGSAGRFTERGANGKMFGTEVLCRCPTPLLWINNAALSLLLLFRVTRVFVLALTRGVFRKRVYSLSRQLFKVEWTHCGCRERLLL